MIYRKIKYYSLAALLSNILISSDAFAAVTFVSATNAASNTQVFDERSERVFVFGGIADGDSTVLTFSTDSSCPGIAMTGGAEFSANWSCTGGAITATVTNRGGMSFGPSPNGNPGTFYVTFSNPPTPPGLDSAPAAMFGIQISVFGDVSSWDLSGDVSGTGVVFGVELSGTQGGEAHFRMDFPQAAVAFLGNILGVYVGGKPYPFASVTTNSDGCVSIDVDIDNLTGSSSSSKIATKANIVTKKITTGARTLGIGFNKTSVKLGKSASLAMCAGTTFKAGDKIPVKFTIGSKAASISKTLKLDSKGWATSSVSTKSISTGTLTAKVVYKGSSAKGTITMEMSGGQQSNLNSNELFEKRDRLVRFIKENFIADVAFGFAKRNGS